MKTMKWWRWFPGVLMLAAAFAGCGGDDDDDSGGGGGDNDYLCALIAECGLSSDLGIGSMDECVAYLDGLDDATRACLMDATNCGEFADCLGIGDDDDDTGDDDTADDDTEPECVDEPTLVGDDIPEPPMSDAEFYATICPDAADPGAYEEVTLTYDTSDVPTTAATGWTDGSVEAVRFRPEHPFHLKSVEYYFYNDCGEVVSRVVPDLLGSVFVHDEDLNTPVHMLVPQDAGWVDVPVRDWNIVAGADQPFWVAYEHTAKAPYLGQDDGSNVQYTSVFWDQDWALANAPWTHGQPDHNYLVRAKGNYFCKQEDRWFENVADSAGLGPDLHKGRTGWADVNNDGWDDIVVATGGYDENGFSVFRNDGGTFTDITDASGLNGFGAGIAVFADVNNDGNLDAYLGVNTPETGYTDYYSTILLGDGNGVFTEAPSNGVDMIFDVTYGGEPIQHRPSHVAAAFADYDGDGYVDLYTGNWEIEYPYATAYPDVLFKGNGDGTFTDKTEDAAITPNNRPAYGVTWSDYNNDGYIDIAVANYGGSMNSLFENQGDGTFVEVGQTKGFALAGDNKAGTSFGIDFGDIDNDGDLDAYESTIQHPRFQGVTGGSTMHRSSGAPDFNFTDVTAALGITRDEGEIDGSFADFDNDGRLDIFLSDLYTGHYGRLYHQNADGTFTDVTYESGIDMHDCTNHAWGDFDMDGDLDLLVTRRSDGAQTALWKNNIGQDNHWVTFRLIGDGSTTNSAACGARVTLTAGALVQIREVQCGRGHASAMPSLPVEFGLGDQATIDSVKVDWPGGGDETWTSPPIERFINLEQGETGLTYYDE